MAAASLIPPTVRRYGVIFTDPYVYMQYLNTTPHRYGYPGSQPYGGPGASQGAPFHGTQFTSMPHAGGTLSKYVVHNFICLCFMVEDSYVIIYTQDHNSSLEQGRLRITLCRHQEDMKELLPIHHHHLQHRVRTIICTELHSLFECCLILFCDL